MYFDLTFISSSIHSTQISDLPIYLTSDPTPHSTCPNGLDLGIKIFDIGRSTPLWVDIRV